VSDFKRSVDFYQGLFGLPVVTRGDNAIRLQIGNGPQHLGISTPPDRPMPRLDHFCLSVDGYDEAQIAGALTARGFAKTTGDAKAMQYLAPAGAPEFTIFDADGIEFQLVDARFSRGPVTQPSPTKGLIPGVAFSHVTIMTSDPTRSNRLFQSLFGAGVRAYQGVDRPAVAIGTGVEFVFFTQSVAPAINHVCLSLRDFDPDRILKTLESYGIKPRESQTGPVGPMRHYITLRREDRGGTKDGTPELYFTDPDGVLVQLQDSSYCGGGGFLGNQCVG
jgi:catechol 2,3-dioxygenase-like lactoylglutathione lyase family enzyme